MLLATLMALTGCAAKPSTGPLGAVATSRPTTATRVYLLRGFQDWYSAGIDRLASELDARGVHAHAFAEAEWNEVADALLHEQAVTNNTKLVLIGFSYGADDVISIARRLNDDANHKRVDLLITIDPVTPAAVPTNVQRCVNFYQSNGPWDALPWLRGIPLQREPYGTTLPLENINIRNRADLYEPDTSHATIAANEKVHRAIIDLILELNAPAATQPTTTRTLPLAASQTR